MERSTRLDALVEQLGLQNVANLIAGCDRLTRLLAELSLLERERFRILLSDVIANEAETLPDAGMFLLETIAKGIDAQEIDFVPNPKTPDRDTH